MAPTAFLLAPAANGGEKDLTTKRENDGGSIAKLSVVFLLAVVAGIIDSDWCWRQCLSAWQCMPRSGSFRCEPMHACMSTRLLEAHLRLRVGRRRLEDGGEPRNAPAAAVMAGRRQWRHPGFGLPRQGGERLRGSLGMLHARRIAPKLTLCRGIDDDGRRPDLEKKQPDLFDDGDLVRFHWPSCT